MRRQAKPHSKGFTLVEVIVVLVVLAILAAILIPAMTGWIDEAKRKRLITECRTCVTAAQTLVVEEYGRTGQPKAPNPSETKALARVPGGVYGIDLIANSAQIWHLTYTEDGQSVTYCANAHHGDYYIFGAGSAGFLTDGAAIAENLGALHTLAANTTVVVGGEDKHFGSRIDSSGVGQGSGFTDAMMATGNWGALGEGLSNINIQEWSIQKESGTDIVWITDQNLAAYNAGDWVRVMRFNTARNTYTAGYMKVIDDEGTHKLDRIASYKELELPADKWWEYAPAETNAGTAAEIFNSMPLNKPD